MKMIMKGKKGIVLGIANKKSIAYGIAKACQEQGAQMAITFLNERFEQKLAPIAEDLACGSRLYPCDVSKPEEIKALKESLEKDMGQIDFIVHSIAFAPKEGLSGRFVDISKEALKKQFCTVDLRCLTDVLLEMVMAPRSWWLTWHITRSVSGFLLTH